MAHTKADVLGKPLTGWQLQFYTVIFEADTRAGRQFDQALIAIILASVAVVVADSVHGISQRFHAELTLLEWLFTLLFTLEYVARLACVRHPMRYALSFYGVVDLLALLPTYLALLVPEVGALIDVRVLRLLRAPCDHHHAHLPGMPDRRPHAGSQLLPSLWRPLARLCPGRAPNLIGQ